MGRIIKYIKRGLRYVIHGQPIVQISPRITVLAQNELLTGRMALITGGTRGIGRSIADAFLNAGADVIITSRTSATAERVVAELKNKYPSRSIYGMVMDNSDVKQLKDGFDDIINKVYPRQVDILVNNAGILGGWLGDTTADEWNEVLEVNLRGVFFLSEHFVQYMKSRNIKGNILMIASSSSLRPAISAYTISKWGLRGFTLGLAKVCAPYGITVNGIAPGPTATEMLGQNDTSNIFLDSSPISRYSLPEEIAGMATVLCSNMGKSIVGDIVYMTGGAGLITLDDMKYNI